MLKPDTFALTAVLAALAPLSNDLCGLVAARFCAGSAWSVALAMLVMVSLVVAL